MTAQDRPRLRVVVVDDHTVMRAGVVALLAPEPGIEVVGEADDGRAGVSLVEELAPEENWDVDAPGESYSLVCSKTISGAKKAGVPALLVRSESSRRIGS